MKTPEDRHGCIMF